MENKCVFCWHARMRKDICGTYCTGGFENKDGTCDRYIYCHDKKAIKEFKAGKEHD